MWPIYIIHLAVIGSLVWAAFNKHPLVHLTAVLLLASEVAGYFLAPNIRTDDFIFDDLEMMWWLYGPFFIPIMLWQAASQAPLWVLPPLGAGVLAATAAWLVLWRRRKLRIWAPFSIAVGALFAWLAAEALVEITMRVGAREIAGACRIERQSALTMLISGLSYPASHRHGSMRDGVNEYDWQFSRGGWVLAGRCPPRPPGATWSNACDCSPGH